MVKKIPSCYNCVFAYLDQEITLKCYEARILNYPACANHPESYGRMKRTPPRGICPNYRPRPDKPEGDIRQIALGDGFYTYVDAADCEWLSRWQWSLVGQYAARTEKGKVILMHREILRPSKGKIIDQKNRNKLDNTRDNLRVCTHAQNAYNRPKRKGSASRFKGVGRRKKGNKVYACVYCRGDQFHLGVFEDELDAARVHDAQAVELFGEFAQLNFPEEWPQERRDAVAREKAKGRRKTSSATEARRTQRRTPQGRRRSVAATQASPSPGRTTNPKPKRQTPKNKKARRKTDFTTETRITRRRKTGGK